MLLGICVFGGYALVFTVQFYLTTTIYRKSSHWFNGLLALVFGIAGAKLLLNQYSETFSQEL
jgi:hypothetical protein